MRLIGLLFTQFIRVVYLMRHPSVPRWLKLMMVLTLLYVISPVDLIPDFIPKVGWIDDVTLLTFVTLIFVSRGNRDVLQKEGQKHDKPDGPTVTTTYRFKNPAEEKQKEETE